MPPKRLTRGKVTFRRVLTGFDDVLRQLRRFDPTSKSEMRLKGTNLRLTRTVAEGIFVIGQMRDAAARALDGSWCEDFEAQYEPPEPPPEPPPERRGRGRRSRGGRSGRRS
jgi:hypothetical protein